jgi:hypothetical protein
MTPGASTILSTLDGGVVMTVVDEWTGLPVLRIDIDPDKADEMASMLIRLAAVARRDGVNR